MTDTTFFAGLQISAIRWWLNEPVEINRLGDGSILKGSLGAALWRGEATIAKRHHRDLAAMEARIARLQRPGQTFLAFDPRYNGPRADPGGVVLGANTPVLHTLAANNREIRISGLPSGYVISDGDLVGWQYGTNPVIHALHQVVAGATASSGGLTPLIEVTPFVRPGVVPGSTQVALVRPTIKAVLESADYGHGVRVFTQGATLRFIQTLR
ncbi:MAG: hypothetical protein HLUCCA12_12190 [Rhodobacteraceae bacterium HLUCCA12]|nr:MAG: hypothetical protein HLUCCA12_12190 [Rhodobacteraceae bacterium HLUCCA12]